MVKAFLVLLAIISSNAKADLFDFASDSGGRENKVPALIQKLKGLKMETEPAFDETFNQNVKEIENAIEQEKLFCAGEATDKEGKTLPPAQKQLCMRELKKSYVEAMDVIFDLKKKYLGMIHSQQLKNLDGIQQKLKSDIEKNF